MRSLPSFGRKLLKSEPKQSNLAENIKFLEQNKGMATLRVPEVLPSPTQDCELLKKSFKGMGTDEKTIVWILGHRNASQRKKIRDTYQQLYNESLVSRLYSELFGEFREAIILWTSDLAASDAKLAQKILNMRKKDVRQLKIIVEIACAASPHHLMAVRQAYCSLFNCSLEEDIASNFSPPLRKLLVGLVSSYRYDKEAVDSNIASSDASRLHEAIKTKQLYHDEVLWILCTSNVYQLRATFEFYRKNYGNPVDQDIKSCGNDISESLLKVVICCLESPEKYFAQVIKDSIIGLGTDEETLTRAIVTRAEIDLAKIREQYHHLYKASLDEAVINDTSGDYKNFLVTLLGERT